MDEPTIKIREAWASDAAALARVHIDAWRTTYRGILPADALAQLSYERRERGWNEILAPDPARRQFTYVAEDQTGQVVGFSNAGRETSGDPVYTGELYAIYLLEPFQHRGVGRRLMRVAVDALMDAGHTKMLLWVMADNTLGRRFYDRLAGRVLREKPSELFGVALSLIAYGWDDLPALAAAAGPA
jgi:ribosomal protein S18 acetylase RimI-like enzyme